MKRVWLALTVVLLVVVICFSSVLYSLLQTQSVPLQGDEFFFGVTCGSNSVQDAETLIDKVKGYTNLFVVNSYDLSLNETALTQICDYAVHANLNVIVYFDFILYNVTSNIGSFYNASTWEEYGVSPFHVQWLNNARERWGDKFLGVYLADEPGGNQIDLGYWGGNNVSRSGRTITTFENVSDYADAANRFVTGLNRSRSMQILTNTSYPDGLTRSMPVFTSDYALYWFDYKAGYDTVFAQIGGLGGVSSKMQQIALCRGAANVQGKDWGAIITWTYNDPPYYEDGSSMLADMNMAYQAGAKYLLVFNFPQINPYGALTEEHFQAMETFWNQIRNSPRTLIKGQAAFVLPEDYGWGMRSPQDKIWGLWQADSQSTVIWDKMVTLIDEYGLNLDIVYDEPAFNLQGKYQEIYNWNQPLP